MYTNYCSNVECSFNVVKNLSETINNNTYSYRLTENPYTSDNGSVIPVYGIEVEEQSMNDHQVNCIKRDSVEYISPKLQKVSSLLSMLYNNAVSPVHLVDVIGEYVDEYAEDFDEK